tara:strand:- start:668 stop:2392 length:1725 start_codon:yes stop_codon:yes gene_type:complete
MKLLVKEYLSSLKERGELDAILPDLLSEMGLHVYSRPAVGVRQNGVDLAAVGNDDDGIRKVFLLTVKPGHLKRADWNGTTQSLRPSLDEILDSYIPRRIPRQYTRLPIVICICIGGDVDQNIDSDLADFENRFSKPGLEFQRWDGDRIANMLMSAVLSDRLLPEAARSSFRKAVAMIDEPESSYQYFSEMVELLDRNIGKRQRDLVTFSRQLNLCVWILYVWSRDANNLEAPYRCSELAALWCWKTTSPFLGKNTKPAKDMGSSMMHLIKLHVTIARDLVTIRYLPNANTRDGLSTAVQSRSSTDVNLKMFEVVGRLALTGIWQQFFLERSDELTDEGKAQVEDDLTGYTNGLISILNNNGALRSPIMDSHAIEVNLVCMFLAMRGRYDAIRDWTGQVLPACLFAFHVNSAYPAALSEYEDLAEHPQPREDEDYFRNATAGSTLVPSLVIWQKLTNRDAVFHELSMFLKKELSHCTLQLWVPNESSEQHIYTHSNIHGLALLGLEITDTAEELLDVVFEECRQTQGCFNRLSAIRLGFWPIVLAACRHHRVAIPVHFWRDFDDRKTPESDRNDT